MPYRAFSQEWVDACANQLRGSNTYQLAGQHWHWPLLLVLVVPDAPDQLIYLDLQYGQCHEARLGNTTDIAHVPFILEASLTTWQQVLTSQVDPIVAIMRRQLLLKKGSLTTLAMHAAAAKALVATVASVDTLFVMPSADTATAVSLVEQPTTPSLAIPFVTTSRKGLDYESVPMRLWRKAKRFGIWNPEDIDFKRDRSDWQGLDATQRDLLLRLTGMFVAGEESVTLELLPLITTIAREGRLDEEMFLTTFLWEEAKHVDFFAHGFLRQIAPDAGDLTCYHSPAYKRMFYEELPQAMQALTTDHSPAALIRASVTYNMIVEGVLAETGYEAYFAALSRNNLLPGLCHGITLLKQDESRHIAYGVFLLSRLIAADHSLWAVAEARMNELFPIAMELISEIFTAYDVMPFSLQLDEFANIAITNFSRRMRHIEKAQYQSLTAVLQHTPDADLQ